MLRLASTQPGLRRTFSGELVMNALNVPVRASGRRRRDSFRKPRAVERRRFSVASREHGPRPTWPHALGFLVRTHAKSSASTFRGQVQIATPDLASAQRAHSKLQKPPSARGSPRRGGVPAARAPPTVTEHGREGGAAAVTPCSSEPPGAAPPPGQRSGGFCQLVRAVRPHATEHWPYNSPREPRVELERSRTAGCFRVRPYGHRGSCAPETRLA